MKLPDMPPGMHLKRKTCFTTCGPVDSWDWHARFMPYDDAEGYDFGTAQQAADNAWGWWDRYCMERRKP